MTFSLPPAGLPRDPAQWLAILAAIAVLAAARRLVAPGARNGPFIALAALSAAALSAAYVAVYLRGGPRIIDATSYLLEARAIARGHLAWPLHAPETSVLGRFLVRSEWPDGARVAVIFPPGYPALLALGVLARAPLAVGPLLAAAIAAVTFDLARRVAPDDPASPVSTARIAALFSVVCAALRYHTADTMSHGLAALCFTAALAFTLRALDARTPSRATAAMLLAGLAAGWLLATRPASALALTPVLALALARPAPQHTSRARLTLLLSLGALPGLALFLAHQRAATGAWGASSQQLYYAVSDGPEGCFRYGFGAGIGCVHEHGDFVRANLANGYGLVAALGTTLRRLKMHLVDAANAEPLALLVPIGAALAWRTPRSRLLVIAVLAQIAAYSPFYFDGNYPAGGARFYADVLPIEHLLAALAVVHFASRPRASRPALRAASVLALALLGFAFRAGFDHAQLRDRDGGRPLFEPSELARAAVSSGLLFLDTDHGFNLAFDPAATDLVAARFHGDALDRLTWEAHGRPPAYRYRISTPPGGGPASISLTPLSFDSAPSPIEGESLWPPLSQRGGFALPEWASGTCASAARWLALHPGRGDGPTEITVEVPPSFAAGRSLRARLGISPGVAGELELAVDGTRTALHPLAAPPGQALDCLETPSFPVPSGARRVTLTLRRLSPAGLLALDRLDPIAVRPGEND